MSPHIRYLIPNFILEMSPDDENIFEERGGAG